MLYLVTFDFDSKELFTPQRIERAPRRVPNPEEIHFENWSLQRKDFLPGTTLRQPSRRAGPVGNIGTDYWKVDKVTGLKDSITIHKCCSQM